MISVHLLHIQNTQSVGLIDQRRVSEFQLIHGVALGSSLIFSRLLQNGRFLIKSSFGILKVCMAVTQL